MYGFSPVWFISDTCKNDLSDTIVSFVWFLKCLFIWDTCETDHNFYICIASLLYRFLCAKKMMCLRKWLITILSILIHNHRQYVIGRFHKHRIHLFMDFLKSLSFEKIFNITKRTICWEVLAPSGAFARLLQYHLSHEWGGSWFHTWSDGEDHEFYHNHLGRIMKFSQTSVRNSYPSPPDN